MLVYVRILRGKGIVRYVHEVVDGDATNTTDPGLHVAKTNVEVLADTLLGDGAGDVHVEQILLANLDVLAAVEELVGGGHVLVEDLKGDAGKGGVGNPGTVVAGAGLAELVGTDTLHGLVVGGLVVLDGDLGSHATHGVDAALVAGLDEELDVGVHEGDGHGDARAVGEDEGGVVAELLDGGEDVIPATAVEAGGVLAELVDDLVHLEGGEDGLDQDGTTDGAAGNAAVVLGEVEGVVPETGLEVRLHLGEVEVGAEAALDELLGVVEEVETEVEEGTADGLAINGDVLLLKVPATGADDEGGESPVGAELVLLLALLEVDLATDGVVEVHLAVDHVGPGRGAGVLEVGHVGVDIGVESVDDHLAVGGTGDLNAAVDKTGSGRRTLPCGVLTDVLGLGEEVGEDTAVDLGLADLAALEEVLAGLVEGTVKEGDEGESLGSQDLPLVLLNGAADGDALEKSLDGSHCDVCVGGIILKRKC